MNAVLERADLRRAFFSNATRLNRANLGGKSKEDGASFADVFWGGANLEVVGWSSIKTLGDEQKTRQSTTALPYRYRAAARANRQLSLALRDQGLVEVHLFVVSRSARRVWIPAGTQPGCVLAPHPGIGRSFLCPRTSRMVRSARGEPDGLSWTRFLLSAISARGSTGDDRSS